jgi:hypothetical protein
VEWRFPLSLGDFEHFETFISRQDIDYIASLGMDHIRLGFDQIVLEESPGIYRERIWRLIDDFIDWCEQAGVNVVLNMHKAVGNYCDIPEAVSLMDDAALQDRFIKMWLAFEERYQSKKNIAFELLNEVRNIDPDLWNNLAERTIGAIRALNPDRKLIVGGTCWNSCAKLQCLPEFDEKTIYTWHFYAPFEFTHQQGVLQAAPLYYNRRMPYPGPIETYRDYQRFVHKASEPYSNYDKMDSDFLRDAMRPAFEFAANHPERKLWCGEFGTIRHCPIAWRENYMRDAIRLLIEHKMPYCVWNYLSTPNDGNRFSLVDDDSRKILSPELAKIITGQV